MEGIARPGVAQEVRRCQSACGRSSRIAALRGLTILTSIIALDTLEKIGTFHKKP
jgi:hypothetical protein